MRAAATSADRRPETDSRNERASERSGELTCTRQLQSPARVEPPNNPGELAVCRRGIDGERGSYAQTGSPGGRIPAFVPFQIPAVHCSEQICRVVSCRVASVCNTTLTDTCYINFVDRKKLEITAVPDLIAMRITRCLQSPHVKSLRLPSCSLSQKHLFNAANRIR